MQEESCQHKQAQKKESRQKKGRPPPRGPMRLGGAAAETRGDPVVISLPTTSRCASRDRAASAVGDATALQLSRGFRAERTGNVHWERRNAHLPQRFDPKEGSRA